MHYKEKVNQLIIRIYEKKLTTTMDNKSLLNKNSFREDEFPFFFIFVCVCSDFISTVDNALEENCHFSCGNCLPVLKIWVSYITFHKSITMFRNTLNVLCCLFLLEYVFNSSMSFLGKSSFVCHM